MHTHSVLFSHRPLSRLSALETGLPGRLRRRFLLPILSVLVFCPGLAGVASAGVDTWTTNGPEGLVIAALAIDPSTPTTLYAGTSGGGVFKSTDGGGRWRAVNEGMNTTFTVTALVIDPATPATLYAGTGLGLVSGDASGVFKSTNGGRSWTAINAGLTSAYGLSAPSMFALAMDPSAPATLYASTYTGGVFKSTDGGGSWSATARVATRGNALIVSALVIDPSAPATLYAGTGYNNEFAPGEGVFKSTNGGQSWSRINAGLTDSSVVALAMDPSAPATLYAGTVYGGVFKTTDSGGSWTAINTGLTDTEVQALAIDPSAPGTLYAGTYAGGVFKSTDAGVSWTEMNAGLGTPNVTALAIDPSLPTKLYAGTDGGVYDIGADTDGGVYEPCVPGPKTLCLSDGRFKVTTRWETSDGRSGSGRAVATKGNVGYFTFLNRRNVEMTVKVFNRCSSDGSFWVHARGQTNVYFVMTVTDSFTGAVKTYTNPQGSPFRQIQDTRAFETC